MKNGTKATKRTKILFVYTNINGFHENCYSFGLASIVGITRANGYDTRVVIVEKQEEYSKVLDYCNKFNPDIAGFSSVSSQFNFIKELARLIKQKTPEVITVCGGVLPTINPECILEASSLDALFIGESENSFTEFLEKIEKGLSYKDTDNLAYVENRNLVVNKLKPLVCNLDSLPYPDREVYPFERYVKKAGYAPFFFSRGCPYLCSYCSNHAIAKVYGLSRNCPRYRSPESSVREIEDAISRFNIDRILIMDDIFGLDKRWREEFCEKYRKRIGIKFQCVLRVDFIDKDFVKLLKEAKCYEISIGVESGNEHVRKEIMNRRMSNDKIIKAFDTIHRYGIRTNAINIIGIPGETEDMLWDTIKLNRRIKPASSGVNVFYPYKGTKLGDECFKEGIVDEDLYRNFSRERRETVLKYSETYRSKLAYYWENWERLVYPFDLKRNLTRLIRETFIWRSLRKLKHAVIKITGRKREVLKNA